MDGSRFSPGTACRTRAFLYLG